MSYVLDALKKSDQERQRHSAPGINAVHEGVERPKSRILWPYFLSLVLLLNAGLMLWWIHPWQSEKTAAAKKDSFARESIAERIPEATDKAVGQMHEAPRQAEQTAANDSKPEAPATGPEMPAETIPAQPKAATAIAGSKFSSSAFSKSEKVSAPENSSLPRPENEAARSKHLSAANLALSEAIKKEGAGKVGKVEPGTAGAQKKPSAAAIAGLPLDRIQQLRHAINGDGAKRAQTRPGEFASKASQEATVSLPPEVPTSVEQRVSSGSKRNSRFESDSEPEKGVAQLQDLPVQIRSEVPNLSFSMLIYSKNPAERVARVNGQVVHEGEDVTAGLKLEQITPNGAIFSFRGYRFLKGVL